MGDFNKQICRLCLVMSPTCECETIDEIKKEILEVLQINIDFDISNCAVACNRCLERLRDCFDFKSRIITTLMEDIKKTSQREMIGESLCLEKLQVCQLCMSLIKEEAYNYTTDLKGALLLEDMIRNCFPEVDLNTHIHESHTCKQCVSSLERHYEFMKCCQEAEQKIVHFCQVAGHCTADKVNLEDMLKFKDYDMLGTPLNIKKEYSDTEIVDENAIQCPKSEDIASIECEEIQIKDELDNGNKSTDCNRFEDSRSSKDATETRMSASKGKKYSCHKCHYSSDRSYHIKRHMPTHSDNEVHECMLCNFITNTRFSLRAHMANHRGSIKRYGCPECTFETDHKGTIDNHILNHKDNSEGKYKCALCPLKTKYKGVLTSHQKMLHKDPQEIPKYKCEVCNHESKYKRNITLHMQTHQDPKVAYKFQCEKCPFKTKWKGSFKRHVTETHEDSNVAYKFQCEICPFNTKWKRNLQKHVTSHHIRHSYSCNQCSYSSNIKRNLVMHQLCHTESYRATLIYKCMLCSYQTRSNTSLRLHLIRTHTDRSELPKFKCTRCPYETIYKKHLLMHMRRFHDIENQLKLKCDLCNYKTTEKDYMRRHMIVHREATLQCYQCDFQTRWKSSLKCHMKRHQVDSCPPNKKQTISLRGNKNRNLKKKKNEEKKRIKKKV